MTNFNEKLSTDNLPAKRKRTEAETLLWLTELDQYLKNLKNEILEEIPRLEAEAKLKGLIK